MATVITMIGQLVIYCAWLEASVIDSSNWVVGGSDSSVAVETNIEDDRPIRTEREPRGFI